MVFHRKTMVFAAFIALFISACGGAEVAEETPESEVVEAMLPLETACEPYQNLEGEADFSVIVIIDIGRIDDGTFNEYAWNGASAAHECMGFDSLDYLETETVDDFGATMTEAVRRAPDVIVTVGFQLGDITLLTAERNPDIDFIGIDQFQIAFPPNYSGILFREDQGGFLAGALAALLSESGTVGFVGGLEVVPPVVRFSNGFVSGAKYVDPMVETLTAYTDSFVDEPQGREVARGFLDQGADVIFGAGGLTGSGAVLEAAENGAWGIGVDQDEYYTTFGSGEVSGVEYLASSAMKRVDLGVLVQIGKAYTSELESGQFDLTVSNGGITYAPFHDAEISQDVIDQLEEIRRDLAEGELQTGVDPASGLPNY